MPPNKKGMELSANMIVIMVIAVAMLAMGLRFSMKFFDKAETMRLNVNRQTEDKIQSLLDDGSLVANPLNRKEVKSGDSAIFAMGINNQLDVGGSTNSFLVHISYNKGYPTPPVANCPQPATFKISTAKTSGQPGDQPVNDQLTILKNQKENVLIGIETPNNAVPCTYVWDVEVFYDDDDTPPASTSDPHYGNDLYKLYLKVL